MLWGFSPALDLLEETKFHCSYRNMEEVNILLICSQDPRHILKTIAQRYRDDKPIRINFYVIEVCLEVIARHMILLMIATEPAEELGLREKTRLFMEIFGNTLLRPPSATYVINKTVQLIHGVTNLEFLKFRLPFIKLDKLKYKERDGLENIFKFWQKEKFKISKSWDSRNREFLGVRYDTRRGVFDWDYHMKLRDIEGCRVINQGEYMNWRETGVAFTWLETEFSVPNPTFVFGVVKAGDKLLHFGYHGDIQFSPYFAFGIDCPDEEMFRTINGVHSHRATDITEKNLMRMFYELENRSDYCSEVSGKDDVCMGTLVTQIGVINVEDTYQHPEPDRSVDDYPSLLIDHTVTFLTLNSLSDLPKKPDFNCFFDLVYLSHAFLDKSNGIMATAKNNSVLIVETQKAFFNLKKEEKLKFGKKIEEFAHTNCCEKLFDFDPCESYYAFFNKKINVYEDPDPTTMNSC